MHTHYSHEFIESQKSRLLQSREEITAELGKIARFDEASGTYMAMQPEFETDSPEDAADNSVESEVAQTNMALISDHEKMLEDVNAALAKIEAGKYGICEATGEWIPEERLQAYPEARTCEEEA